LHVEGAKPKSGRLRCRERVVSVRLSESEWQQLRRVAEASGVNVSTYVRREVVKRSELSRESALILAELGRLKLLLKRLWETSAEGEIQPSDVGGIVAQVEAVDGRVLLARALGGK